MSGSARPDKALKTGLERLRSKRPTAFEGHEIIRSFLESGAGAVDTSDRAAVLVCTSLLEHALEEAILTHLPACNADIRRRLFSGHDEKEAPLQSLYGMSYLAYSLGVFGPQTLKVLDIIRQVRNVCAHNPVQFHFGIEEVSPLRVLLPTSDDTMFIVLGLSIDKDLRVAFLEQVLLYYTYFSDIDPEKPVPKLYAEHPERHHFS